MASSHIGISICLNLGMIRIILVMILLLRRMVFIPWLIDVSRIHINKVDVISSTFSILLDSALAELENFGVVICVYK